MHRLILSTPPRHGLAVLLAAICLPQAPAVADTLYTVRQTYSVKDLPDGAQRIRGWFWMPEDRPEQRVIEFRVLRRAVSGTAAPEKAGPITDQHRRAFAAELRRDEKHMEVTPQIREIADGLAGKETNPVLQARKFFDYVIAKSDHYSNFGPAPKGKCLGDATECLLGTGDCCTDQHALFIALCRARGIPCRLMYGSRLKPENAGKDHDPGYRCWPNFFAPGLGWVPLDISSADTAGDRAGDWFGGLDDRRLEWAEGRDFDLEPRSAVRPDLVIRGWLEVDGKPHAGLVRVLNFRSQDLPGSAPATAALAQPAAK